MAVFTGPKVRFGARELSSPKPWIMGVLNVTPDSFSDGGALYRDRRPDLDLIRARAEAMLSEGADILDIGGESTRPGAAPVSLAEESDRVLPVVEMLAREFDTVLSVDTSAPEIMRQAAALGAGLINDVRALRRPGAEEAAAETGLAVCLMHMQGEPESMQQAPRYRDVVEEVFAFLAERKSACVDRGIDPGKLLVDPGIGFGKTDTQNLQLISALHRLTPLAPVLLGVSRKSLLGRLLGREPEGRLAGSLALALRGVAQGARVLRVHDVAATADAVKMWLLTEQMAQQ